MRERRYPLQTGDDSWPSEPIPRHFKLVTLYKKALQVLALV